jgi:hypothetical protein
MARIRNIKPAFFKDAELYDAEAESGLPLRVAYAGLWTVADREGRFKWRPREIKTDVLPYDNVDMGKVLDALAKSHKIIKYKAGGCDYGFIPNFAKHQFVNRNEVQSQIPAPFENSNEYSAATPISEQNDEYTGTSDTDTDDLTQTQTMVSAAPPPTKPARKITTLLPENFPTAEDMQAACAYWAERSRVDLVDTVQDEGQAFRAHHLQHGNRMADWGQAWVTWYGRALKFNRKPKNGQRSAHENFALGAYLAGDNDAA